MEKGADWSPTTLGKLGRYLNGRAFKKSEWSTHGRPIIRIQNLTGTSDVFNYYAGDVKEQHVVRRGDLLISWAATLGAYIWSGPEAVVNQHIFKVESLIDVRFHRYLLDAKLAELMLETHGSGIVHITRKRFDAIPVLLPSRREQLSIVEALDSNLSYLDRAAASLHSARRRMKSIRSSFLAQAITDTSPKIALAELVVESRTGWDRGRVLQNAQKFGYPYLKMSNISTDGDLLLAQHVYATGTDKEADRYRLRVGDVLFNNRNSYELVGKVTVADRRVQGWTYNNNLVRLRFNDTILPEYAAIQMNSEHFKRSLQAIASATTNVAAVYTRDLLRLQLHVPPLREQLSVVRRYADLSAANSRLEGALEAATLRGHALRSSLIAVALGQKSGSTPVGSPREESTND